MVDIATPIRVELAQLRPDKGRVDANLARVREWAAGSAGEVDLLVFPECVTSGYFVEGAVEEVSRTAGEVAAGLGAAEPGSPDIVLGFYESGDGPTYNAAGWFTPDEGAYRLVHRHRKMFLPTYGVFDESRFVSPGTAMEAFETRFGRAGMLVCEEMHHSLPPAILALDGAELLVVVSASPARDFSPGPGFPLSLERWDLVGRSAALEHGIHVAIAQLVGSEGGKVFGGGSAFYLPGGEVGPKAPLFDEGSVRAVIDRTARHRYRARSPLLSDLRSRLPHLLASIRASGGGGPARRTVEALGPSVDGRAASRRAPAELPDPDDSSPLDLDLPLVERTLVTFLRDEIVERRGFHDVVVGVSGGVDSATSLLLAVRALGPEHVHAVFLPYATPPCPERPRRWAARRPSGPASPPERSRSPPRWTRTWTGRSRIFPTCAGGTWPRASGPSFYGIKRPVWVPSRWERETRANGSSATSPGHADDSPPINPLGDLFKTQVWALARQLGVPEEIVVKAPSADLVRGVHDESEIGVRYEVADRILYWLLEGYRPEDLVRAGFAEEAVERIRARLQGTHWKRELPTVATLSENAIGEFYLRPVDY